MEGKDEVALEGVAGEVARDVGSLFQGIVIERGAEGSDTVAGGWGIVDFFDGAVAELKEEKDFVVANNFIPETRIEVLDEQGLVGFEASGGNQEAAIGGVGAL